VSNQAQQAREEFGARLRELRKDAGLTGRALADRSGWKLPKVSKIEHGRQAASEQDIRTWCHVCGVEEQIPDLIASARNIEAMWLEWKRTLQTGAQRRQEASIKLDRNTRLFRVYHPALVWGTLQTAEYATEILQRVLDFHEAPDDLGCAVFPVCRPWRGNRWA
jgi:transcriptional regulator with XRE-family HTH domain